jgi:hypothetical protein
VNILDIENARDLNLFFENIGFKSINSLDLNKGIFLFIPIISKAVFKNILFENVAIDNENSALFYFFTTENRA